MMPSSIPSTPTKNRPATPRKQRNNSCFVCGLQKHELKTKLHLVSSGVGQDTGIPGLIEDYLNVDGTGHKVCEGCRDKFRTIDKKIAHMQALYRSKPDAAEEATKRCANDTPGKSKPSKHRNTGPSPTKRSPGKSPGNSPGKSRNSSAVWSTAKKLNYGQSQPPSPSVSEFNAYSTPETSGRRAGGKKLDFEALRSSAYSTPESPVVRSSVRKLVSKIPVPVVRIRPKGKPPKPPATSKTPVVHDHDYAESSMLQPLPPYVIEMASTMQSTSSNIRADVILPTDTAMVGIGVRTGDRMSKLQSYRKKDSGVAAIDMLSDFSWNDIATEMMKRFPLLFRVIVSAMLNESDRTKPEKIAKIIPRIGMVYALIAQTRYTSLSLVQRMISTILLDSAAPVQFPIDSSYNQESCGRSIEGSIFNMITMYPNTFNILYS